MKLTDKRLMILLIAFHAVMLALFVCIVTSGVLLRWRLGYVIFWLAALSGMAFYFIRKNNISKIYSICWIGLSVIGVIVTLVNYDSVYCETDKYIMKEPSEIIGFDSAILYEKSGLLEIEKQRYKGVYPQSMIPLDSIGAIVIFGEFNNGETLEKDVSILPIDDSFDEEKSKDYARKHNITFY